MRDLIKLIENAADVATPAEAFIQDFWDNSHANWMNDRQRIVGGAGVMISRSVQDRANNVHISDIVSGETGKGYASEALKLLCALADKHGVTLDLTAKAYLTGQQAKGRLTTKQLVDWYGRYGFVKTGRGGDDGGFDMIRKPPRKLSLGNTMRTVDVARDAEGGDASSAPTPIKLRGFNRKH